MSRADTLFDVVTRLAGRAAAFWGRDIDWDLANAVGFASMWEKAAGV